MNPDPFLKEPTLNICTAVVDGNTDTNKFAFHFVKLVRIWSIAINSLLETDLFPGRWLLLHYMTKLYHSPERVWVDFIMLNCLLIDVNCNIRFNKITFFASCPPSGPLKVVVPTESVSAYLGDTALLRCEVSGDPTPIIRWQKNREDLPLTFDPDSRLAALPSGSLQVSRVQPPDSATYRCLADNPGSTRTGTDAELRVLPGNRVASTCCQPSHFLELICAPCHKSAGSLLAVRAPWAPRCPIICNCPCTIHFITEIAAIW